MWLFLFATFITNFIATVLKLATSRKHFMKDDVQIANEHRKWVSALLVTRKAMMTSRKDLCYTQNNGCLEVCLDYAMMKTWNRKNSDFYLQNLFRIVWYHFKIEIWKQSTLHSCVSLRYTPIQTCSQVHQKRDRRFLGTAIHKS